MIEREEALIDTLRRLKEQYGATAIKMSFETENLGTFELLKTKEIATNAGINILMKLGGCEALTDIEIAKQMGAKVILGPMIESKFALQKYLQMCKKVLGDSDVKFMINIETIESCKNINDILKADNIQLLDAVVVGRTDLCLSMKNSDVNSKEVFDVVRGLFKTVKENNIGCVLGGGITPKSIGFFEGLNGFETRKVVFGSTDKAKKNLEDCLKLSLDFELGWYEMKKAYYLERSMEDDKKINEILSAVKCQ